jgi:hypothetical protein
MGPMIFGGTPPKTFKVQKKNQHTKVIEKILKRKQKD